MACYFLRGLYFKTHSQTWMFPISGQLQHRFRDSPGLVVWISHHISCCPSYSYKVTQMIGGVATDDWQWTRDCTSYSYKVTQMIGGVATDDWQWTRDCTSYSYKVTEMIGGVATDDWQWTVQFWWTSLDNYCGLWKRLCQSVWGQDLTGIYHDVTNQICLTRDATSTLFLGQLSATSQKTWFIPEIWWLTPARTSYPTGAAL
jgi:hypothetical protein